MKKFFIMAVAAIAALSSCSSDIASGEENNGAKTLMAKMEVAGSRATIDYNADDTATPKWEVGDQININGATYKTKSAGTESELIAAGAATASAPYTAYFPASLNETGTPTLPNVISETYVDGKFNMPMYAYSDNNHLHFKNLCGVLAIKVDANDIESLKSIRVSNPNKDFWGEFEINNEGAAYFPYCALSPRNTLTVNYTVAVSPAAEGNVFYIAIPAAIYGGLKIELSSNGTTYTKSMTTKAGQNIEVERNRIYEIDFADNTPTTGTAKATIDGTEVDVNWVQLWADGPRWAEYNIGVTDGKPESYGSYFAWGETASKGINDYYGVENESKNPYVPTDWTSNITPCYRHGLIYYYLFMNKASYDYAEYWEHQYDGAGVIWKYNTGTHYIPQNYTTNLNNGTLGINKRDAVDNKTTLELVDDAAHANWGGKWRMPTRTDYEALIANCTVEAVVINDIKGYKFTGSQTGYTDRSVFFPAGGLIYEDSGPSYRKGQAGVYMTASLNGDYDLAAYNFSFNYGGEPSSSDFAPGIGSSMRYFGRSVRAIYDPTME